MTVVHVVLGVVALLAVWTFMESARTRRIIKRTSELNRETSRILAEDAHRFIHPDGTPRRKADPANNAGRIEGGVQS